MRLATNARFNILRVLVLFSGSVGLTTCGQDDRLDFNRDIRPLLANSCFQCHGPDAQTREAELRLDVFEEATAARNGQRAIVPGNPEASELLKRVRSTDPDLVMPPPDSKRALTPEQIGRLEQWIREGASMRQHWAFVPPERPSVPASMLAGWSRNEIDHFVARRLVDARMVPAPEADRLTLLRRLYLDLIGLPPTEQQIEAFLEDDSDRAFDRVVDQLLASPHYGERWGRFWLDAARYADSDGYEKDKPRQVWFYRDWVINAFNRDMPYDQFVIEQIAGDLIPGASQAQRVATGFLRNSMTNEEGGIDPEQFRMEAMFDRMDAIGKSVLGLTIQCSQCHSHKFDPLTQAEYYQLFAFLNDAHEANITVYTPSEQQQRAMLFEQIRTLEDTIREQFPDWLAKQRVWEESVREATADWTVLRPAVDDISSGGQKYLPQPDGSFLAQGYAPTKHRVMMTEELAGGTITGFQLELMRDENLPRGGPGRSVLGTAALSEFEVDVAPAGDPSRKTRIRFAHAVADRETRESPLAPIYDDRSKASRRVGPASLAIDGDETTAWSHDVGPGRRNDDCRIVFVPEQPIELAEPSVITIYLSQKHGGWNSDDNQTHNLGRFRLSYTGDPEHVIDPVPVTVRRLLDIPAERRTARQTAAVFSHFRTTVDAWADINQQIEHIWQQHPEGTTQLALLERDSGRTTRVLERGNFLKPAAVVTPGTPAFLHPFPENAPRNRLGFARWLVDRRSPSTARSIVNRVWQQYFGTGLVATSEDLGVQSSPPSHPELLDWLSVEFMESGWKFKHLHRLIVDSATYRQSAAASAEALQRDPANRLLGRGARFRVDAELVRDVCLAASGLLDRTTGGPPEYPPAPEFLFLPPVSYGPKVWKSNPGAPRFRRGVYTFRYRSVPYPALQTFDAPNGDFSCVRRDRSNTPLQALTTWNEPVFVRCAQQLAQSLVELDVESDRRRLDHAFRRVLTRLPAETERGVLLTLLQAERQHYAAAPAAARQLTGQVPGQAEAGGHAAATVELAAWTAVARVLLNLDETITRQ